MRRLLATVAALLCLIAPASAAAYNPLHDACSNTQASDATACNVGNGSKDPIGGPNGALKRVSLVIAVVAGIAAVIIIVIGGLEYVMSGGDAQKTASARSAIIGAAVGLVIIVAAESILLFVVSKL